MRNVIKYFYGLNVTNIRQKNDIYFLEIDGSDYLFCKCDLDKFKNVLKIIDTNFNYHKLVRTINGDICVFFNDTYYVLLKVKTISKKICIDDIIASHYFINVDPSIKNHWIELWSNNIDYFEYQLNESDMAFTILAKYAAYYIGLAENAIQLLKSIDSTGLEVYTAHKRVSHNTDLITLYNPTMVIFDTKVRDIAEYYKSVFFTADISSRKNILNELLGILKNLTSVEKNMFFARMLYPSYFFDAYDKLMFNGENIIDMYIDKIGDYELFLKHIYEYIKKTTYIDNIDWLIIQ